MVLNTNFNELRNTRTTAQRLDAALFVLFPFRA